MAYLAEMSRSPPRHSNGYRVAGAASGLGPGLKKCGHCQEIKDAVEFSADASRGDGLRGWCKSCEAEARSKRYKKRKAASENQSSKRRQGDNAHNSHRANAYQQRSHSPYAQNGNQYAGAAPYATSGASAALQNAAAVRQEVLAAYNQQLALQAAQAQSPQLAVQMALLRAAAQLQGPHNESGFSGALGGGALSQGYPMQSTPMQLAALEMIRQHANGGQLGLAPALPAQQPWMAAVKQEPPHAAFAPVGSPQTSDSELSAVESLTGMKLDKSRPSPAKGGMAGGLTPSSAPTLKSGSVTMSAKPAGCAFTAALAEASQQRQSSRDISIVLTRAPGSTESAASPAASADSAATAQQHKLINEYLVSVGQPALSAEALSAMLSNLPAAHPASAAAATSLRSLSAPAVHAQAHSQAHPAIGGLLSKLSSFSSSSSSLAPREAQALFDGVPRRARTLTEAALVAPKTYVAQQDAASAALAALLSQLPTDGDSRSLHGVMDRNTLLNPATHGALVHRPVPTVPLPTPVTGARPTGTPLLSEPLSVSPSTVPADISAVKLAQGGEPAAWLSQVLLLLLALRAVGFAHAAQ